MNDNLREDLLRQREVLVKKILVEESRHCHRVAAKYKRFLKKLDEKLKEE